MNIRPTLYEQLASTMVGTPLEEVARNAKRLLGLRKRWRHPELAELYLEEVRSSRLFRTVIRGDLNCVDVGAHLGSVLSQFCRLAPSGQHIAIEPLPYKAEWLRRKFPQVTVHQMAVSDQPDEVDFYYRPRRSGFSSLRSHGSNNEASRSLRVRCARLDDLIPTERPIRFIKIDVEGAELCVLHGARRILRQNRPLVLFECTQTGLKAFGFTAEQVFEFLRELEYDIFLIREYLAQGPALDLPRFESAMHYPFQAFNFVAAPR